MTETKDLIVTQPEEIVYQSCYATVDVGSMLAGAETRSRIRRLPIPQLYFGLRELDDDEVGRLLPHVTEEQWRGVLDLGVWSRDRVRRGAFLALQRHLLTAEDAVARKIFRASDADLWELCFKRDLRVFARTDAETFAGEPGHGREWVVTPDDNFMVVLPKEPEKARLLRALLQRLYQLDPQRVADLMLGTLARTSAEIEETAYQLRKSRIEDLGFQDYYDAIGIYTELAPSERLPEKQWEWSEQVALTPVPAGALPAGTPLLLQALARLRDSAESPKLLEELFFVSNKVLSADRVSPADPDRVKRGIRKAVAGINLGLDVWSEGSLSKAVEGLRKHYLQSFFQMGFHFLLQLQRKARAIGERRPSAAGTPEEALLQSLLRRYPTRIRRIEDRFRRRFVRDRKDLRRVEKLLDRMERSD